LLTTLPAFSPFFLAFRNMRTRLWRTALTVAGIVLGVAVVLAIQITNESTLESLRRVFDQAAGQANLLVVTPAEAPPGQTLDETVRYRLPADAGIEVVAPSVHVQTVLAREAAINEVNFSIGGASSGTALHLYGIDPALDPQVRIYALAAGRLPTVGRYEVAIPQKYADEKALHLDDDLVILATTGVERLRIVGLLAEDGAALLHDGAVAFAPLEVVQDLFARRGTLDELALRVTPRLADDPQALEALRQALNARLGAAGAVIYPAARGQLVSQMLATYQLGLGFFSLISLFVGAFLIYNTFSMTVVERTREIGMLRAIGMNRFQVIRMVLAEALIVALLGSALGLVGGIALARGLMRLMGAVVTTAPNLLSVPLAGLAYSLAVGVGVTLAAALLPAVQAARISPLEALRARGRSGQGVRRSVWLSGLLLIFVGWAAIYRIPWRQALIFSVGSTAILGILFGATLTVPLVVRLLERITRPMATLLYRNAGAIGSSNVHRSVGRTTLTVAALMIALTMVIGVGSLAYSFEKDITAWIDTALGGDLYIHAPQVMRETFGRQLLTVPGVAVVTPARVISVRLAPASLPEAAASDTLVYYAIDPLTYRQVNGIEFATGQGDPAAAWQRLEQGKALFVSTTVADQYNVHQGDALVLYTHRGAQAFTVAAEVVDFAGQGLIVTGTYEDLHRWFGEQGVDRFTVKVQPGYQVADVAAEIEARYQERRNVSTGTTEVFKRKIRNLMNQAFRLFDVLSLIAVIIGGLGVVNTLTMNVLERQREIGGLRSLGMMRGQVLHMVLAEALALGLIGGLYGLGFGYGMAQVLVRGMNLMNGYELSYVFSAQPFVAGALIALFVSQGAALYPARSAARVNIVEAIKHE
jgi:putative ABC transport system permease protein